MSITSLINPSGNVSAQDTLWSIAYSDNSGQVDFKYVFDIYKNGQQLIRTKVFPEPSNGRGYFDAGNVIRNQMKFDWFVPSNGGSYLASPDNSGQSSVIYDVRVGEDYSGVTTLNMASGTVRAYNYTPLVFNRKQSQSTANGWATNRPLTAKIGRYDKFLIPIRHNGTKIYLKTEAWNPNTSAFDLTCIDNVGNQSATDGGYSRIYTQLDIGFGAVSGTIGLSCFDFNQNEFMDVKFHTNLTTVTPFRLYYDCDERYKHINLYFINAYGVFDTARFKLVSKLSMDVERKTFEKRDYKFNNTNVEYYNTNNVYIENKINYGSKANWTYKLTMDYPTDAEYQWLAELFISPQIYAGIDGYYYPVTIKNTNYEYVQQKWAGLRSLEVDIELNQTRYGFRR